MSKFILVDKYNDDKPKYFKQMTGIGPMATPNIEEAEKFDTEEDAKTSSAHRHWSANWHIEKVEEPVSPPPTRTKA